MENLQALTEIQNQISQLQAQEKKIRAAHLATVITDINQKIAAYDLTPADLKFKADVPKAQTPKTTKKAAVKYKDGNGQTWSGRGLKPNWLKAAIAGGAQLSEFEA